MNAATPPEASLDLDACRNFQSAWWHGGPQALERFLPPEDRPNYLATLEELVLLDMELRYKAAGATEPVPRVDDYVTRFPCLDRPEVVRRLRRHEDNLRRRYGCGREVVNNDPGHTGTWRRHASAISEEEALPQRISRYRVERILGEGSFGRVYLAQDDQLNRPVAIKVPHRRLVSRPEDAAVYLTEARTVANLDHPNIVPVHDVGNTDDCPCFIVSKYIQGNTLAEKISDQRPSFEEATELLATIAEALHYAHCKGVVHRDIKPGNILIDQSGKPFVVDFGLALQEEQVGQGPKYVGTPAYMSPEQARGEGHRVDGRSDLFSLGVLFYELLAGRKPFGASSQAELLEQITTFEPRPLRQINEDIPKELERVCFKALSKRASERYMTARDMADDLRHFLTRSRSTAEALTGNNPEDFRPVASGASRTSFTTSRAPTSDSRPIKIVPKGLRSFDEHDADFFLELLPGPRDREGLPDSIRFWKTKIEETDPEKTFAVGLICGPSGCGKSSLMKAGLLPRLSDNVIAVYLEASALETEIRLLNGLCKCCPALLANSDLKETLAALRRGQGIPVGKKVVIVLDQFEQWLHAKKEEENTELVQALRQCDGGRLQCVVLVRDEFWMAVIRFMRDLEIRLMEGQNSAAVDLFPLRHAEKVLAAFGRAFGVLSDETSKEQKEFLTRAVSGLAEDNKVICVRLALFAEMMKGRPWTPVTLKEVGGTQGVGVTFLEETFSAATAPPEHRYHQKAAQAVLKALLPEAGTNIKGHMRSQQELREASGYVHRPRDFEELLRILDSELRLLTPTDPEGVAGDEWRVAEQKDAAASPPTHHPPPTTRYYQLTHDYLVHSVREWLTRKQKETRRGRAELLLADRAAVWNARPENRQLPSLFQWFQIRWLTQKKNWTPPQRKMMRKATRYHALRGLVLAVLLALLGWGGYKGYGTLKAHALRDSLLAANTNEVPAIVKDIAPYRRWLDPLLHDAYARAAQDTDRTKQLHASLALLPVDATQVEYLYGRLLDAEPNEVPVIRDFLAPHKEELLDRLWALAESPPKGQEAQRLRAAAALAKYEPKSAKWAKVQEAVANDLVAVPAVHLAPWLESLRPVREKLLTPLAQVYRDDTRRETERSLATDILADYAADNPQLLADLLMDADEKQFAVLYRVAGGEWRVAGQIAALLASEIDKKLPAELPSSDERREKLAKRQANAAVALLRMNQPEKVWPLLRHPPTAYPPPATPHPPPPCDPRVRSYLIHRLGPLGADAAVLVKRLEEEPDLTIRRALLLSLGEYADQTWPKEAKQLVVEQVREIYLSADDPGLHGAAEWLLRQWNEQAWLKQIDDGWKKEAQEQKQKEKRLETITLALSKEKDKKAQWYVNGQGQTIVVLPGPVEFLMGSPPTEEGRQGGPKGKVETQHKKRIGRTFAIAAREVTVAQFRQFYNAIFNKEHDHNPIYAPTDDCPANTVTWYEAAHYCNWLSEQEGIPKDQWCYEPHPHKGYAEGMKLVPGYLKLTGYRLPSEAEWEYACRAGALTSRYYGESEELLGKYAWFSKNSLARGMLPGVAGQLAVRGNCLKPNDFGLFDMLGNAYEWCEESFSGDSGDEDKEDLRDITDITSRVLRGGSFLLRASVVRSADRFWYVPTNRHNAVGFRPARTLR